MARDLPSRTPLSNVDAAWLHMEDPTNLMMVTGIMRFAEPVDHRKLRMVLETRLLAHDRFRMRIVESRIPGVKPHWELDEHFSLDNHVHHVALPPPGDDETLRAMVGDLMSRPLDYSKPLWSVHVIDGHRDGGGVTLTRLHHCIADGIALVRVMLSLCDQSPKVRVAATGRARASRLGNGSMAGMLLHGVSDLISHPGHAVDAAQFAAASGFDLMRLVLLPPDPKTVLKGDLGTQKRVAWSDGYPVSRVKEMRAVVGCTVNDVLIAALAGALRRYMLGRGEELDGKGIRAMVPVNLRPLDEPLRLGNNFGLVVLDLPVGLDNPLDRLFETRRRMDVLKHSPEAYVGLGLLNAMGASPPEVQRLATTFFGTKATAVLTNVPGPQEYLHMAGSRIEDVMFWVPQSAHLGLGISIISYAGNVRIGVASDARLVPDPQAIADAYLAELESLLEWAHRVPAHTELAVPGKVVPRRQRAAPTPAGGPGRARPVAVARRGTRRPTTAG